MSADHDNGEFLFSNCPCVRWPKVRLLDIHCGHRYGSAEYVQLFQQAVQGIVEKDLFPQLDTLCVNSKFVSKVKRIDFSFESWNNCLDNVMQNATELVYLQELAESCLSLITTSVSGENDELAYLKYVRGLKKVNSAMVAMSGVDENPFANKSFILKLMRMASSHSVDLTAGRFDWKTMRIQLQSAWTLPSTTPRRKGSGSPLPEASTGICRASSVVSRWTSSR